MASDDNFLTDSCFWYYAALALALIISGWLCILIGMNMDVQRPQNVQYWQYYPQNVIPYIIWTGTVLAFTAGAHQADCIDKPVPTSTIITYRTLFAFTVALNLAALFCFWILRNMLACVVSLIAILALVCALIIMYSFTNVDNAWVVFFYFLTIAYFTYVAYYAYANA